MDFSSLDDYEPERSPEWAGYLSDEQFGAVENIFESICNSSIFQFHLILGVAGTGKTQVLLSIAEDLKDAGYKVVYHFSEPLKKYLESCGISLVSDKNSEGAIHLVDDPSTMRKLKNQFHFAQDSKARAIVVAVDPFQFQERKALIKFAHYLHPEMASQEFRDSSSIVKEIYKDVVYSEIPKVHWLKTVYRQQANVGRQVLDLTKNILSRNNPYIIEKRKNEWSKIIESQLRGAFEEIRFVSDGGLVEVLESASPEQDLLECIKLHLRIPNRWNWTSSFLLVSEGPYSRLEESKPKYSFEEMPQRDLDFDAITRRRKSVGLAPLSRDQEIEAKQLKEGQTVREIVRFYDGEVCPYSAPELVRGKEYQEVFVVISKRKYDFIRKQNEGLGSDIWKEILPLHTFTTRAKSKVTLILTK